MAVLRVHAARPLEDLHHGLLPVHLQDLALADLPIGQVHVHDLSEGRVLHILHDHQGALDTHDGLVVQARLDLVVPGGRSRLGRRRLRHTDDG